MSIRNVINDQNKSWLTGNFNNVDANEYEATADDIVTMDGAVDIQLSGASGTAGQEIRKNGSNQLSWFTPPDSAGDHLHYGTYAGPETNDTITYQPRYQLTFTGLTAGNYVCFFSAELQNPGAVAYAQISDIPFTQLNEWAIPAHPEFHGISGFVILNITTSAFGFIYSIKSGTPGQVTTIRNMRMFFWKI